MYTLLGLGKKSKDNVEARLELKEMKIRASLWPQYQSSGRAYLPPTYFTMSLNEKEMFHEVLQNAKFPHGYASNISHWIRKRKISGLKTQDCQVIMQELLPLALKKSTDKRIHSVLTELCTFFRVLCSKVLKLEEFKLLEEKIPETLSTMEKLPSPPGFFIVMVYLVTHLATEAIFAGPTHYRWMYPIERYLGTIKSYVRNRACPEGSIAEAYIANECLKFCSRYLEGGDSRSYWSRKCDGEIQHETSKEECLFPSTGESYGQEDVFEMDDKTLLEEHRHVLFDCDFEVVENYKKQVKELEATSDISKDVKVLAKGPSNIAKRFSAYDTESYASSRDNAPKSTYITYYGKMNDIVELNYYEELKVVLFKCDWIDATKSRGVKEDDLSFTLVNFSCLQDSGNRERHEPFIFAE
ncbi:uncharacterized protein LOC124898547 [Capsicum annuum]|uniref:uncharacterized protein LOC124898547 n=1 Tax=Capsicum annuum TaxID=4072 RepID=UPI001FB189F8|nr:uncharacterized protein LOC124898547 [Capsicum annuum]